MRNCENCGLGIPDDAISCDYCGQKVSIKTHRPIDKTHVSTQDIAAKPLAGAENSLPDSTTVSQEGGQSTLYSGDVGEGEAVSSFPTQPTTPGSSAKTRNPVILALFLVTVIFALVLSGVIAAYSYWHPTSTVTRRPVSRVTSAPSMQITSQPESGHANG